MIYQAFNLIGDYNLKEGPEDNNLCLVNSTKWLALKSFQV